MSRAAKDPADPTSQPFVVGPDGGEHVRFLATRMTIKATAPGTAGALGVVEVRTAPGFSPPLHLHHCEDEAFWLLEGRMTVLCDGQMLAAGMGRSSGSPEAGRTHSESTVTRPPVSWSSSPPWDRAEFYIEGGQPALDDSIPEFEPEDLARVHVLYQKYQLEDVGPPLTAADHA